MNWFVAAVRKYAQFSGRAQRSEYWFYFLFYLLIVAGLAFVDTLTGTYEPDTGLGLLSSLFVLAMLLPSLAVGARRLHDTGRSAWWLLIGIVPLAGVLVLLVFALQDSQPGSNRYGPNPKGLA